jgi:AraC family transcriptional regulator, regulatory protein of adaptative response / DNA-3-methyladenine glycosylase II
MPQMELDRDACYRAVRARDARFDGRFFVAVRTTGIYCRPICPARCPKLDNIVFHASAASAQEAGFRPCLRCRPECAPELAGWRATSRTVSRALALIGEGALDEGDVDALAARLGLGERQLRRLFDQHIGASPIAVAQTRRVLLAKQLLHETPMKMVDVAFAAGFGSLRRFNATFHRLYGRAPSALRRELSAATAPARDGSPITLTLSFAPPYDWPAMLAFFAARAIPGVEEVVGDRYRRTIDLHGGHGVIEVAPLRRRNALAATIRFADVRALPAIIGRIRNLFDLGSDIAAINAQLAEDLFLAAHVAARPGLRVPGAWDPFELAMRAVLGQQVSVTAARALAAKLAAAHGEPLASGPDGGLTTVFPRPERIAIAAIVLPMPSARIATLRAIAAAVIADPKLFDGDGDLDAKLARLRALPGVGEWTAQYIAMRALREPDAFPAADIGLLRAMTDRDGQRPTPAALLACAERWRPWRAYAAQHLWSSSGEIADREPSDTRNDASQFRAPLQEAST